VSQILYCPDCEGIVESGARRCTICGNDLTVNQALLQPPSYYRDQAELLAAQEAAEPSMALGVLAWIAQAISALGVFVLCILPVILLVLGTIIFLVVSARG
jgi:hypothetical protein